MRNKTSLFLLKYWKVAGLLTVVLIVISLSGILARRDLKHNKLPIPANPQFVGRATCVECHQKENDLWQGSHHDKAMDIATENTVLGDFNNVEFKHNGQTHRMFRKDGKYFMHTQGTGGEFHDYQIDFTFGYTPLQQYLVPFEGGKLQCLPIAWDTENKKWFHLGDTVYQGQDIKPDNWLYWTNQAQNWNGMCADCHSTNLKKNYDVNTGTYRTTWSEIDVSCEACHGPASEHLSWARIPEGSRPNTMNTGLVVKTSGLNNRELLNVCARCHSRRSILSDYENNNADLLNYMIPQLITQPTYHADGQILDEDYEYASFTQSKMFANNVKCSNCHDVHSVKTLKDGNHLCLQCHVSEKYNTPNHHFHEMADTNERPKFTNRGEPKYREGSGAQCVNCHMTGKYYMGNDYRRDHSFRIPRPDLTLSIGTPNACNACHIDKSASWAQLYIEKWYGIKTRIHYGETFAAAHHGDPKAIENLIQFATDTSYRLMVRATAIELLGNYNDPLCNKIIENALSDTQSLIRQTAIMSYKPFDAASYEKKLAPLLTDPVKGIRTEVAIRLSEIPENLLSEPIKKALKSALEEFKSVNLYVSDFPGGRYNLGLMYTNLGNLEQAAISYREALKIDGLFNQAKINLAMVYNQQGKNEEAEKLFREVLIENPELSEINYSLALLLAEKGSLEESRKYFIKAADLMPANTRVIYNLALLENSQGNYVQAESYFLKALKQEPDNYDFLYAICTFYLEKGQNTKALPFAKKLTKKFPENPVGKQLVQAALQK